MHTQRPATLIGIHSLCPTAPRRCRSIAADRYIPRCDGGNYRHTRLAAAIRALKIPIGRVLSSDPCRNRDTATRLGFGEVEITEDLNPVPSQASIDLGAAREKRLREIPPRGANTILVSHVHGSRKKSEWMHLELAEIIVYRPNGATATAPIARIRVETWQELLRAAGL